MKKLKDFSIPEAKLSTASKIRTYFPTRGNSPFRSTTQSSPILNQYKNQPASSSLSEPSSQSSHQPRHPKQQRFSR